MHLSFEDFATYVSSNYYRFEVPAGEDIDSRIFHSVPTSFFVLDRRVPKVIRELITEAGGCLKMGFLTGASACARKAVYELTVLHKAEGKNYEEKIKSLKTKHPSIDPTFFDVLSHIQDMTSDKMHEQSWPKWDSASLRSIMETLKAVLYEIHVLPREKKAKVNAIQQLLEKVKKETKETEESV